MKKKDVVAPIPKKSCTKEPMDPDIYLGDVYLIVSDTMAVKEPTQYP